MSEETSMIPLPRPTELSRPHWDGCREGKLRVQRCGSCGGLVFIPRPTCTRCLAEDLEWVESTGRGVLYSYTVVHRPQRPEFRVPYVVAIVELEEGWHMLSNLVETDPDEIAIGMPLEVTYRKMTDEITLPYFRPVRASAVQAG